MAYVSGLSECQIARLRGHISSLSAVMDGACIVSPCYPWGRKSHCHRQRWGKPSQPPPARIDHFGRRSRWRQDKDEEKDVRVHILATSVTNRCCMHITDHVTRALLEGAPMACKVPTFSTSTGPRHALLDAPTLSTSSARSTESTIKAACLPIFLPNRLAF